MTNKIGIDDKVKVVLGEGKENVVGNGETVTITQISKMSGEIYYIGEYHVKCPEGGEGYDTTIQFKEGEYLTPEEAEKLEAEKQAQSITDDIDV